MIYWQPNLPAVAPDLPRFGQQGASCFDWLQKANLENEWGRSTAG